MIKLNNKGREVFILGDINIDFLKYNSDNQTSEYLDMLLDQGIMPLITNYLYPYRPYLYKYASKGSENRNMLSNILDHLPVFCTISNKLPINKDTHFYRDFKNFDSDLFLNDIRNINFNIFVKSDVNENMHDIINALQEISDKDATFRKVSNKKRNN
jgi:hypothetical protein